MARIVGEITLTETKVFIHKLKMWLEDVIGRRALNWRACLEKYIKRSAASAFSDTAQSF